MVGNIVTYTKLSWEFFKRNLSGHMEYRIPFFVEVFGMVVNNFAFVLVWVIFFTQFQQIKGWGINEILLLNALAGMYYGLVVTFVGGWLRLGRLISDGALDYYLLFPKDPLWHLGASRMPASAIGEILFGFIAFSMSIYSHNIEGWLTYLLIGLLSAVIFGQFVVLAHSLNFFFFNSHESTQEIVWTTIGLAMTPQNVYEGPVKLVVLFIFPSFIIAGLPVEAMRAFTLWNVGVLAGVALLLSILTHFVFRYGLKRYESGNMIQQNV